MKIGIDISQVVYGTGVSTYIRNLVKNLLKIDKENYYVLFGGSLRRKTDLVNFFSSLRGNYESHTLPISPTIADVLWNRLHFLNIENLIGKIDVFHSSDWSQPPSNAFKVNTIHDLVPFKFPKLSHPRIVSAHKRRFAWVKREVDRIIVPSNVIKEDLEAEGIEKDKIRVIPEAPDPIFRHTKRAEIEKLKRKYKISGKYLLAVGVNPRKNTKRIIEAHEKVRDEEDLKLIIVGHLYTKIKLARGVRLLGHVPQDAMPVFYSGAEALVYPSLYEGFGLPILEAFSCDTPVVTSNLGSLKEVAGEAAVLVDPYDADSIAEGIKKALKGRRELVKSGVKRVKRFYWQKTAKETLDVYKEARN
jgi:glycosyltransferase involved in cell wall biosynthesis